MERSITDHETIRLIRLNSESITTKASSRLEFRNSSGGAGTSRRICYPKISRVSGHRNSDTLMDGVGHILHASGVDSRRRANWISAKALHNFQIRTESIGRGWSDPIMTPMQRGSASRIIGRKTNRRKKSDGEYGSQ